MRPSSAERPSSAHSIQSGTRQRLQHPSARRVYAIENGYPVSATESKSNSAETFQLSSTDIESVGHDEPKEMQNPNSDGQDYPLISPLRHLYVKRANTDPVKVAIRCVFLRIGEIDTLNERYYAELLLEATWKEPAIKGSQKRAFDRTVNWTPELEMVNSIGNMNDEVTYTVRHDQQGQATVTEHHKMKGILWERMELQHFPLDVQDLSLSITSSRTNSELSFVRNERKPSGVNRRIFTDEQEWHLFEHVDIVVSEQNTDYFDDGHNHPIVICSCYAARRCGYYIWNAYFLIFLITSASFTTFPIPLANIQGRVQIACTLLLTSITFRWLCNKALPAISYLTAVDIYAIGSIFSLCLLNIYHGVIGYINYYSSTSRGPVISVPSIIVIDRWALAVFTILFFTYQIGTAIWMYLVPWKKRRIMFKKDSQNRLSLVANNQHAKTGFLDLLAGKKSTPGTTNNVINNGSNGALGR